MPNTGAPRVPTAATEAVVVQYAGNGCPRLFSNQATAKIKLGHKGLKQASTDARVFQAIAHRLIDLCAITPFARRQCHNRVMDSGINRRSATERPYRPCPP